jgi:CheY-like chemotaxis protein
MRARHTHISRHARSSICSRRTIARSIVRRAVDNVDAAHMLEVASTFESHEVRLAFDGRDAVDAAAALRPDVVVLDIGLPRVNGYDAAQAIRQLPGLADVVIIAATGYGQDLDRAKGREAGIDHHLVRPIDLDALFVLELPRDGPSAAPSFSRAASLA